MGQRIQTGVCSDMRGHGSTDFAVHDSDIGCQFVRDNRVFDAFFPVSDNRQASCLGTGTTGGWDGDKFRLFAQGRYRKWFDQGIEICIWIFVEYPHHLSGINSRTTAKSYDPIRLKLAHRCCAAETCRRGWIFLYTLKNECFKTCFF
ncbi:hypothetical protein D3C73_861660 [compost metagenome]